MDFLPTYIPYSHTHSFSAIATDYVAGDELLKNFYQHPVSMQGVADAIKARQGFAGNRELLVNYLQQQYSPLAQQDKVQQNIRLLLQPNTFTITTAHQPNIFTGHLYFVYKILHAIKLAHTLNEQMPAYHFVPLYYMGSEDADLEELGEVFINGTHYRWTTGQTGAVGRMEVDKAFLEIMNLLAGQLSVQPFGEELINLLQQAYRPGIRIADATLHLLHQLFGRFGLVVLQPDAAALKASFVPVMEKELLQGFSQQAVQQTMAAFPPKYKVQAAGRAINLFYLSDGKRERIEKNGDSWSLADGSRQWNKTELLQELQYHPEAFSPNVILRPLYQEWLLPNICFIGGGGELAYWLELKNVFDAAAVPYPMLLLRNSYSIVSQRSLANMNKMGLQPIDFFEPVPALLERLIKKHSLVQWKLDDIIEQIRALYTRAGAQATQADETLKRHTEALHVAAQKRLLQLEKKIYRAEKRKFEAEQRQLQAIKDSLYPNGILQERIENLLPWYAQYGPAFFDMLYQHALTIEQEFCLLLANEG